MEWEFKSASMTSALSGQCFQPGDSIVCLLIKDATGQLQRMDIKAGELTTAPLPTGTIGKWHHIVKCPSVKVKPKPAYEGAEELFLSLFTSLPSHLTAGAEATEAILSPESEALKQILALLLERKRILKPQGKPHNGLQTYLHPKTQALLYDVPIGPLCPALVATLAPHLQALLF